jgi:methionyl-tRNA formyltransferase
MGQAVKPKLLFFGNERLATGVSTTAPTLKALIDEGYEIAAVVVAQNEARPSRKERRLEVAEVAEEHNIPLISPIPLHEAKDKLAKFGAEAAILVAYGRIIPQEVIDIFPKGIVNIHPSLLPLHRGPTPIESVILHGEKETGVSLMKLVTQMDAGPVFAQETVLLRGNETKQMLADQLLNIGKDMLLQYLPDILDDTLKPSEQDNTRATKDGLITKEDSELDFEKPAIELDRQVRAYAGWPRSRALIGTTEVIITEAHAEDVNGLAGTLWLDGGELALHCSEGTLVIDKLIPPGRKEMTGQAFLAGYSPTD